MSKPDSAQRVHLPRVRLGLSPEQYGARIGCSGMTVRRVEEGYTPTRNTQRKFAAAQHTEVDALWPLSLDRRRSKRERDLERLAKRLGDAGTVAA